MTVADPITLFLCGDVMTGRGIDQVLPHPGDPRIYEPHLTSAVGYVELAEAAHGPLSRPVAFSYVWGDALGELARVRPDVRIVNLETAVTVSGEPWPGKSPTYRMHPANVPCLQTAGIDCCVLANNHALDWGRSGLAETLAVLHGAGLRTAGAGRDGEEAAAPALVEVPGKGRVVVFAFGSESAGIPRDWQATPERPGVNLVPDEPAEAIRDIARHIRALQRDRTVVVASIHWGDNWRYHVPDWQRSLAHGLIDEAGVDVVHGHSSHHPKALEVYRDRPILYGCGDFLNDYEGIGGYEEYRSDLGLMYFPTLDAATGALVRLEMTPMRVRRFRVGLAAPDEARWLAVLLSREGKRFGTSA
ncbi:MAG TPA: CapA family protein, partial [Candidatus Methylomirabilis sp.]|nr:CapA family protein [Candidatus Methylomirabilis sp.]